MTQIISLTGNSAPQSPTDAPYTAPDFFPTSSQPSPISAAQTPSTSAGLINRTKGRRFSHQQSIRSMSSRSTGERKPAGWETLVLFAVNLSQLDVHVNMSNVMGNTT